MSTLLAAALDYAAGRLPVFPCVPNGKLPAVARGFYAATTNPETIKRYWRVSDRNIGIPTGASGFWVLDIDGEEGESSIRTLEAKHGWLPPTREVLTGGGGRHLWFKCTGPVPSTAGRIAPGIDTRGDTGYVVVPPSVHESGRAYTWSVDSVDELAVAPDWLIQRARTKPQSISERALEKIKEPASAFKTDPNQDAYGHAALDREVEMLAGAPAGTRNHALNRAAFRMKREEQTIHRTIVQHLRTRAKSGVVWWHSPNGGRRDRVEGAIFKSLGVRPGVADLILLHDGRFYALELKAPGGRLTESQSTFLDDVEAAGGIVACAEGLDRALATLEGWHLLRGRTM